MTFDEIMVEQRINERTRDLEHAWRVFEAQQAEPHSLRRSLAMACVRLGRAVDARAVDSHELAHTAR